ncbi:MAG: IS21 family transposase [Cyanobacteria bacterium SZAS LIN-5]|nr:IS21 family transposase [Cyanobacteria bacterium SZAS LIN-5]
MTCTKRQIQLLLKYAADYPVEIAAAKAGMAYSTAKRYLSSKKKTKPASKVPTPRTWRTRTDPFVDVWSQIKEMLERDHGLEAQTLMDWLIESYPEQFQANQVRTLRRRVHDWRVLHGPERKEVMFAQNILPGESSQSDYTHCSELGILINGESFPHLLFHFMLPYSRWEFVWICHSESSRTLTTGYQMAVHELGAVAKIHRTDNLAAAVPIGQHGSFQPGWESFLQHFEVEPSSNNPGKSNENGSVEKSNHLFKHAIDQRLRLRGSREFKSEMEYASFLKVATIERNRLRHERLQEELKFLLPLPADPWYDPRQFSVSVTAWSTVSVAGAIYSVPSRFIGQRLKALVNPNTIRIYYNSHLLVECPRHQPGGRCINYRHIIFHLLRKPGAFRNYQFREELFPRAIFRSAYDALLRWNDEKADKSYLQILNTAVMEGEEQVSAALEVLLQEAKVPCSELVQELCKTKIAVPEVQVLAPSLNTYDALLTTL